jgi:hypothetical protein
VRMFSVACCTMPAPGKSDRVVHSKRERGGRERKPVVQRPESSGAG